MYNIYIPKILRSKDITLPMHETAASSSITEIDLGSALFAYNNVSIALLITCNIN